LRWFRYKFTRLLIFALVFMIAGGATASELLGGERCQVEVGEVIQGDLFAFCGEMTIEGRVEGNVFGAARSVVITGEVTGGVYIAGGEMAFGGKIGKDLHFVGLILTVQNTTEFDHPQGSIISINLSLTLQSDALVPGNISDIGYQLIVDGDVDGEINFWGSALRLASTVGGDVQATVGSVGSNSGASQIETLLIPFPFEIQLVDPGLIVLANARIEGQLEYRSASPGILNEDQLANPPIYHSTGSTTFDPIEPTSAASLQRYFSGLLREFATLAFISIVFLLVIPRQIQSPLRYMQMRPVSTFGVGLLSFIMSFPIVLMMALFSLLIMLVLSLLPIDTVVIISGVVLVLANIGLASIFYFTAIYVARMVAALAIGRFVMQHIIHRFDGSWRSLFFSLMIGDIFLAVATSTSISLVSWGINAMAAFLGLGAILILLQDKVKVFLASSPAAARMRSEYGTTLAKSPRRLPASVPSYPLTSSADQENIGMDDLPKGFDWWGEGS
jgi:hypothetical protein